jgi:tetraacyldisaccharide 4'-kinase
MSLHFWVKELLSRPTGGIAASFALSPFAALARGYGALAVLRRWGHRNGFLRSFHPGVPVISVGNIATGGTGKTPCVEAVCRVLVEAGHRPAVLSRGYGGRLARPWAAVSEGAEILLDPREAGDEPILLARALPGVPVLVGRDRAELARQAVGRYGAEVLILDDGFQHLRLARDLDILTIDARNPFGNGYCLPRGLLREPPSALSAGGMLILTRARGLGPKALEETRARIRERNPAAPLLVASHSPEAVVRLDSGGREPLDSLKGRKLLAFAGIGAPNAFFQDLERLGAKVLQGVPFPDHHAYSSHDLAKLTEWGRLMNVDALLTTEKDGVRLAEFLPLELPLLALSVRMDFPGQEEEFRSLVRNAAPRRAG